MGSVQLAKLELIEIGLETRFDYVERAGESRSSHATDAASN